MMRILTLALGSALLAIVTSCRKEEDMQRVDAKPPPISISELSPLLDQKEVTIKFSVSELGGVSQLSIPEQAPTFLIEATSENPAKDLTVWVEGELANVLDRLEMSFGGSYPLKKGTVLETTGTLTFSPGKGDRIGHEWYALHIDKWQKFRVVPLTRAK